LGRNLKLGEKYKKSPKNGDIIFGNLNLPEHSPTSGQKLTFETNGKTVAPHYQPDVIEDSVDVDVRETNDEGLAICCLSADDVASFFLNLPQIAIFTLRPAY